MSERNITKEFVLYEATYDKIKPDLFFEIVDYKKHKRDLKKVPFHRSANLALRYHFITEWEADHPCKSFSVTYPLMKKWGISKNELLKTARNNTKKLFPFQFRDIDRASFRYLALVLSEEEKDTIYQRLRCIPLYHPYEPGSFHQYRIIGKKMFGSGILCYPRYIQRYLERFHLERHFIYLLPVSRNETVLFASVLPLSVKELKKVSYAMYQSLPVEERLTKEVYQFDYRKRLIKMCQNNVIQIK